LGYEVALIEDGCRGVDLNAGDVQNALNEMHEKGVKMTNSKRLQSITAC
jgi:nicotinamidase/pyrazinamidase